MNRLFERINKKVFVITAVSVLIVIIAAVILAVVLGQSGREKPTDKDETSSETEQTDTAAPDIGGDIFGDGEYDPENTESPLEDGADVSAESLHRESGRANGIDVSKWQGKIDWQAVSADNIDFAFIRIGYRGENGKIYKDDNADYNIQSAAAAGIPVGVYFFSTAINTAEAEAEASWTLSQIEGYGISYPVVYDCEGFTRADSRMYPLSAEERSAAAAAFLNKISAAGYETMLYGAAGELGSSSYWNIKDIAKDHMIWVAHYPTPTYPSTDKPAYSGSFDAWQYTNKGRVNGISGDVDMVVCYFERSAAEPKNKSAAPAKAATPLTEDEKKYSAVSDTVTAKELTNLRSAATTKSEIVAVLKNGETLSRTAIGTNGWSKLVYNGRTVWAITSYLTTDLAPKDTSQTDPENNVKPQDGFESRSDKVRAKELVNLRAAPTTDSEIMGQLGSDSFLERTGENSKGWSRLNYNGKTVYAVSSYLTTEPVSQTTAKDTEQKPVTDGFAPADEQVTAKEETNLRSAPTTQGSEIIYTLKNGEFVQRVGIHTNGWSKLIYNGQTVYAVSSYLTVEVPDTETAAGSDIQ